MSQSGAIIVAIPTTTVPPTTSTMEKPAPIVSLKMTALLYRSQADTNQNGVTIVGTHTIMVQPITFITAKLVLSMSITMMDLMSKLKQMHITSLNGDTTLVTPTITDLSQISIMEKPALIM